MTTVARRVTVHGRVQGVFFRDTCRSEARERDVVGWVTNDPEGTVTAHFEGGADDVDALVAWCSSGPPRAQVTSVDVEEVAPRGLESFSIV